ncbi:uncharacterized protein [Porites lutea]|uniref:uncharacterized protein isoform X2 n=1 Tax=Porites lutea TaxID=51062 RepID=UPI003CC655B8
MYQRVKFVGALLCAVGALMLVLQPCKAKTKRVRLTILKTLLIVDSQGMDVIENAVELTKKAETKASKRVFMEDNHFIKRVAMVETSLNRSSKVGGLWNVDHCAFKTSQSKRKENKRLATLLKTVRRTFGVAWAKVRYSDLRRPLYSVLAARIILEMTERSVPRGLRNQAKFWLETYHACAQKSTQQQEEMKSKFIRVVKRSCHSELLKCEHFCREPANEKAECGCKDGYVLQSDGTSCAAGSSRSPPGTKPAEPQSTETGCGNGLKCEHKCIKYGGKSQCTCNNGYQLHMNGFSCVEKKINCSPNDIACIEKCSQSGNCSCPPGSVMSPDGETCVEVNECSLFRGVCHQNCVNTPRGYRCSCSQGYELDNNGISCTGELWDGEVNTCRRISLSKLRYSPLELSFRKIHQHLTN